MKLYIKKSVQHGRGVFASEAIESGEAIIVFRGPLLERFQVDFSDYHLQIGESLYLGASGGADDFINHSCDPNAGFQNGLTLVAVRDIAPDEEITWDYSTAIDEADFDGFPCSCGAANCRGMVKSFRHLSREAQLRLQPWLLPYLRALYFPR